MNVTRESAEAKVSAGVGAQLKFEVRFLHASTRSGRRVGGGWQSRHCHACQMRTLKRPPFNRAPGLFYDHTWTYRTYHMESAKTASIRSLHVAAIVSDDST